MRISDWSSDVCSSDLEGVLAIAFRVADEQNLLLLDLGDLQAMLVWCAENADELTTKYGNVSKATVGTIQRPLLTLESQGGDHFFGEPAIEFKDMSRLDEHRVGEGCVSKCRSGWGTDH